MLGSIFSEAVSTITTANCLVCMGSAIVLGILISFTHRVTTKTTVNFLLTLALLPLLVFAVILLVNGNLGTSLAVAGAFSLIRFRSMAGTSKELISVFWAMAVGLALGMGYVIFSVVITLIVAVIMIISNKVINKKDLEERKLKIIIPENLDYEEIFNDIFEKHLNKYELEKVKTTNMGSMYELQYMVSLKNGINQKEFLDEIRIRNGNMLVMLERPELIEEVL
jgi:uncharacterized membrane protein YhiD involved in acid resistance